jgi:hypothetical protein
MKEAIKKPLWGGYKPYHERYWGERLSYKVEPLAQPKSFEEAIDIVSFAGLPDIVVYEGSDYHRELIWCAAAWLFGPGSDDLSPERALQEFLDYDRPKPHQQ